MTGHPVAFSVSLERVGKRGDAFVQSVRRVEVFVRERKGHEFLNFARLDSLSIVENVEHDGENSDDDEVGCLVRMG